MSRPSTIAIAVALVMALPGCGGAAGGGAAPASIARTSPLPTAPHLATSSPPPAAATHPAPGPPTAVAMACTAERVLARWPDARLAAQTVVVPVAEDDVGAAGPEVAAGAGGVILFGGSAPADLGTRLTVLRRRAPGGVEPFVMADEEGGDVQRMANLVGSIPSARTMGATMTTRSITELATALGHRMRALGVTMDLAPVLDVDGGVGPNDRDADGTRSFSPDAAVAAADGLAFARGLEAGGVVAVAKHFPGLGGATGNTDVMAAATPPWSTLRRVGLLPFAQAAATPGAPAVMVSNASVPGLSVLPASLARAVVTGVLRDQLGYRGLVLTDSLSSTAVRSAGFSVPAAAAMAIAAGADMVLFTAPAARVAAVTGAIVTALGSALTSGRLARQRLVDAVAHVMAAKGVDLCGAG